ncbi:MAG: isopentenyl-diphosphate Delta-isomerase [Nitrosopumilaceae archaeon]|nr:isopentenyl-diphosphate Delta-isomerase [Nitrosopumilaceae archaeon]NIU00496.1 isopentenyl-diphosphate Delta-isomerase [Nitrosopumilaceae archaeon]NIU86879.1 isopentenyl-diphosphate Delta-isomerase [Nitrosopumilaceae archaeon]NIV65559.1 isopentenyl-diphosphate Delta-isomerase [Nitrosopumilaceae archaeon]NIX61098.1 isopentenyl-diphosphate Delta-isomerase [Nitrosopumilaceae archaeon]
MTEYLILVDKNDNPIGKEEKVKCHLPNGKLHRAFTALIFDSNGKLLLTRRSSSKMLWPDYWDGTVASHPREQETYISSAERRMPEELGVNCKLDYLFKFEYHVPYKDVGSENEICGTLVGLVQDSVKFNPIKEEISEYRWVSIEDLVQELKENSRNFCPWMLIALLCLAESKEVVHGKYGFMKEWTDESVKDVLMPAIKIHLPDDNWGIVS